MTAPDPNSRGDEPTKPLPAAEVPTEAMPVADATDPIDGMVAPHVPVADVSTAQVTALASPDLTRDRRASRLVIVGIVAVAALVVAMFAIGGLQREGLPVPTESTVPPAAPTPETPEEPGPVVEEPAPVGPAPAEPTPEPPAPTEPPAEPTPEPTV